MNNTQRKELAELIEKIRNIQLDLDCIVQDEQDKIYNMPENLQYSEKVERMQEIADEIDSQINNLDNVAVALEEFI